jgi:cellulose synthase/poly-beta-1,6-N-acetylglucosamine synthase-like glycosyltransferase
MIRNFMKADLYFASGGTRQKNENTTNEPFCGGLYFHVFICYFLYFVSFYVAQITHYSSQIYSSASNNLLYGKSVVGLTLETWRLGLTPNGSGDIKS